MKTFAIFTFLLGFAVVEGCKRPEIVQPIAFNHKKHVAESEIGCDVCHAMYQTQHNSGRPTVEICAMCHFEKLGDSPEEQKLVSEYVEPSHEIPWKRIFRTRYDVYYSHRRHVVMGELECEVCHGDIGQSARPPSNPATMKMETCLDCHREKNVTEDCVACHR